MQSASVYYALLFITNTTYVLLNACDAALFMLMHLS